MPDRLNDFLNDTRDFWEFHRQFLASAIINKNYPDFPLAITNLQEMQKSDAIPKERRDLIQRHESALRFAASLEDVRKYCSENGLKFLTEEEIGKAKTEGGALLLEFDKRTRNARKDSGEKLPDEKIN